MNIAIIKVVKKSKKKITIKYLTSEIEIQKNKISVIKKPNIEIKIENHPDKLGIIPYFIRDYNQNEKLGFQYWTKIINIIVYNDQVLSMPLHSSSQDVKEYLSEKVKIPQTDIINIITKKNFKNIFLVELDGDKIKSRFKNQLETSSIMTFYIKTFIILVPYINKSEKTLKKEIFSLKLQKKKIYLYDLFFN